MPTHPPFHLRPFDPTVLEDALLLTAAAGAHGVYVSNALQRGEGEAVLCCSGDDLLGLFWFGPRGNLVLIERLPLDPIQVADAVQRCRWPWRIALGPPAQIDALSERLTGRPLVLRDQIYHGCAPADAVRPPTADASLAVRPAAAADHKRLMEATLELNRTDLNVDPRRVDRRWLRRMVDDRIGEGSSLVIGPAGGLLCKLDLGSAGPAGVVVEGVYTFPEARGRGLARALVGEVAAGVEGPLACLHVAVDNLAARRAYEAAGLLPLQRCRLVLAG